MSTPIRSGGPGKRGPDLATDDRLHARLHRFAIALAKREGSPRFHQGTPVD